MSTWTKHSSRSEDLLPDNAIITYGAGNFSGWATTVPAHARVPFGVLGPRNGSMGFGLPAAVAAGLVHPDRPVFCIAGDGDLLMTGQEMATAVQYGADITVVVNDNSVYRDDSRPSGPGVSGSGDGNGSEEPGLRDHGHGVRRTRHPGRTLRGLPRRVRTGALEHKGLSLVHCLTDPDVRGARLP
jgi:acetolactate synthase-1/2/3 large subunit